MSASNSYSYAFTKTWVVVNTRTPLSLEEAQEQIAIAHAAALRAKFELDVIKDLLVKKGLLSREEIEEAMTAMFKGACEQTVPSEIANGFLPTDLAVSES